MSERVENLVTMLDTYAADGAVNFYTDTNQRVGFICQLKNKITNKKYIGQTVQYPPKNRCDNANRYLGQGKIHDAMMTYGFDSFTFKVICICNKSDLDYYESYFINKFDTIFNGYNSVGGGQIVKQKIQCEETKQRHAEAGRQHKISEEGKRKISEYRKSCVGWKHSDSTKNKMSLNNARSHSVKLIDTLTGKITEYKSIRELVNQNEGFLYTSVVDCCKYKRLYKKRYSVETVEL